MPPPPPPSPSAPPPLDDAATGLPLFRTWRSVYFFVVAAFVIYVALLAALPLIFA